MEEILLKFIIVTSESCVILFAADAGGSTAVEVTTEPSQPVVVPKLGAVCQMIWLVYGFLIHAVPARHQDGEEIAAAWALSSALH